MGASNWDNNRPQDPRYKSARWRKIRKAVLARSRVCSLCGHFVQPHGANVDHIRPVELLSSDAEFFSVANLAVIHGRPGCSICAAASGYAIKGVCNALKGALTLEQAQQRLFRRTGLRWGEVARPARVNKATSVQVPEATDDEFTLDGREW